MKTLILIGLMAALSTGVWAADKKLTNPPKEAVTAPSDMVNTGTGLISGYNPLSLGKTAQAVRKGEINVGKEYSLGSKGRFHKIHAQTLGIKCGGCHSNDTYADNHLYLRKAEFPRIVDGRKVKAVERAKCIGCHSDGNVATVFYNMKN